MKRNKAVSLENIEQMKKERESEVRDGIFELRNIVRKYPLNEFLMLLAALNSPNNNASKHLDSVVKENKQFGLMFQIYIPALAKFAIVNSDDLAGVSNQPFNIAFDDVTKCINIINDIKDYIPYEYAKNIDYAISAFLFQLSNQHYRFQVNLSQLRNTLARAFVLFRDLPAQEYPELNLLSVFHDIYGINQSKLFIITSKLMGIRQNDWFDFNNFSGLNNISHGLSIEDLETYFDFLSIDYDLFRVEAKDLNKSFTEDSSQFYGYSPFDSFPILKHNGKFLIISQHYLIWRIYLPVYFDLLNYFTKKESKKSNSFSTNFGYIFQDYVGIQLEQLDDGSKILNEIKYGKGKKDFTDWSILYEQEKSVILIEVKKHLIPLKAKYLLDKKSLEDTLVNTIIKGLKQIHNKVNAIKLNENGLEFFEEYKSIFPCIITFDDSYQLNNHFIRSMVDSKLLNDGIEFDNDWQIITIRELELLTPSCNSKVSLLELFRKKIKDKDISILDWEYYLNDSEIQIVENRFLQNVLKSEF